MRFLKVRLVRKEMEAQLKTSDMKMPKGLKAREQKLTRMMLFIFSCFLLTYMPGVIVKLVRIRGRGRRRATNWPSRLIQLQLTSRRRRGEAATTAAAF